MRSCNEEADLDSWRPMTYQPSLAQRDDFKTGQRRAKVSIAFPGVLMRSVYWVLKPIFRHKPKQRRCESGSFSIGDRFGPSIDGEQTVSIEAVTDGGLARGGSVPARVGMGMNTDRGQDTIATNGWQLRRGSRGTSVCLASIPARTAIKAMRPPGPI